MIWIKVGITLSSPQEMEMTIRTPRLNYFKTGISITSEGTQLGRAFIDKCNDTSCQTTVAVDSRMLQGLATAKSLRFEYQISESEGVALAVNIENFSKALGELNRIVFPTLVAEAPTPRNPEAWTFTLELRRNANNSSVYTWGSRYPSCYGSPATKIVSVSNLEIKDDRSLEEWLDNTQRCKEGVVWITGEVKTALGEASKYTVYMKVKDKMPYVVTMDMTGQPMQPLKD